MKSAVLLVFATVATPVGFAAEAPMPPDPLVEDLVPVPISTVDLAVRNKTMAPGLNLWRLAGELDAMSTAQVRTIAFGTWRAYRRYDVGGTLVAGNMAASLWAERDLAEAVRTMLFNASWEDMDDTIGDHDIELELSGAQLWGRLAARDWKTASALLRALTGEETIQHFTGIAVDSANLPPVRAAEFIDIMAPKLSPKSLERAAANLASQLTRTHGRAAATKWARTLKSTKAKEAALWRLDAMTDELVPPPIAKVSGDAPLGKLRAMVGEKVSSFFPFPLFRAVRALTPAEAMALAEQAAAVPLETDLWLSWMLFMRAAEGDPAAAAPVARGYYGPPLTDVFALWADEAAAMEAIRRLPEKKDREAAFGGLMTRVSLENPGKWLAEIAGLEVDNACAAPLFARLGAAGRALEACQLAGGFSKAACDTWVLTDVRGFCRALSEAEKSDDPVRKDFARRARESLEMLDVFGARDLLADDDPVPPQYLYWTGFGWMFFPFEERDFTFRFLERHAHDPEYSDPVNQFAAVAVRFDPERAVALVRRQPGEQNLTLSNLLPRLVRFWPEKAEKLFAPASDKDWHYLCQEMVRHHGWRAPALLKNAPHAARAAVADVILADDDPGWRTPAFEKMSISRRKQLAAALRSMK